MKGGNAPSLHNRQIGMRLIKRLARRAGFAPANALSPHSLRRTAITEFLAISGGDLCRAEDFAGHADTRTTRVTTGIAISWTTRGPVRCFRRQAVARSDARSAGCDSGCCRLDGG
ncbi:hypothetical protein Vlu01_00020 [Micromonospora lutea]|uniref:Tyr recombinase domain-containing protein n=1 Tax=Micromonospora lutea TaxID=419825 RepID=A0ABQ4IN98_9ACTN|nr:hypothetical protein Vlu01_00020 [Micromonospora lutea]